MRERFRDVLDIRDSVDEGPNWPADVAPTDPVQINCRKLKFHPLPTRPSGGKWGNSLFFALYGHCASCAQSKQRVASPAIAGLLDLRKCWRPPNDDMRTGVSGENQWHMMSMSLRNKDSVNHAGSPSSIWPMARGHVRRTGSSSSSMRSYFRSPSTSVRGHRSEQSASDRRARDAGH